MSIGPLLNIYAQQEWSRIMRLVREQEKDVGLWAETSSGQAAVLQDALAKLHTLIEEIHLEIDRAEKIDAVYQ